MFLIDKALLTKTKSYGRWFLPSPHTNRNRQKSSLKDFNHSPKCYSESHLSSIHAYFKTLAYFLPFPPSFSQSPWKHKIKCNKISIPIKSNLKKLFLYGIWILMNWGLPGPSLWCFQKHQKIRLVINIISAAWRCLLLHHIQKMQHRIPLWTLPWFYSFFFNFVFKSVLHLLIPRHLALSHPAPSSHKSTRKAF